MTDICSINARMPFNRRILLLLCAFVFGLGLSSFVALIVMTFKGASPAALRISVVLQNLLGMILPALITALFASRNVLAMFGIASAPKLKISLLAVILWIVSIPAMNWVVEWNSGIALPDSMHSLEVWLRSLEDQAAAVTNSLLDNNSVMGLVVTLLTVGVLTGFGEELLFRGTLQRLLQSKPMGIHAAIWISAFMFSFIHMQFYGFVPRLLLGAFFGYAFYWSGSLWLAVFFHALNNSTVVIASYFCGSTNLAGSPFAAIGTVADGSASLAAVSVVASLAIIVLMAFTAKKSD